MVNSEWVTSKIMGLISGLKTHTHDASKITSGTIDAARLPAISASDIKSGVFDVARIPPVALERLVVVADDTARYALTTETVQLGDTVKVTSSGYMYLVVDDTRLDTDAGYAIYTAGGIDAGQIISGTIDAARLPELSEPSGNVEGYLLRHCERSSSSGDITLIPPATTTSSAGTVTLTFPEITDTYIFDDLFIIETPKPTVAVVHLGTYFGGEAESYDANDILIDRVCETPCVYGAIIRNLNVLHAVKIVLQSHDPATSPVSIEGFYLNKLPLKVS